MMPDCGRIPKEISRSSTPLGAPRCAAWACSRASGARSSGPARRRMLFGAKETSSSQLSPTLWAGMSTVTWSDSFRVPSGGTTSRGSDTYRCVASCWWLSAFDSLLTDVSATKPLHSWLNSIGAVGEASPCWMHALSPSAGGAPVTARVSSVGKSNIDSAAALASSPSGPCSSAISMLHVSETQPAVSAALWNDTLSFMPWREACSTMRNPKSSMTASVVRPTRPRQLWSMSYSFMDTQWLTICELYAGPAGCGAVGANALLPVQLLTEDSPDCAADEQSPAAASEASSLTRRAGVHWSASAPVQRLLGGAAATTAAVANELTQRVTAAHQWCHDGGWYK
mmetsp:Transcript_29126/g.86231  ORF Transcript_29126/g.86231 Transcript_29126/m.86231 type:complete len:340 (-) Transcript_29126:945-1964(-)